jgi:hypothetical protein
LGVDDLEKRLANLVRYLKQAYTMDNNIFVNLEYDIWFMTSTRDLHQVNIFFPLDLKA